MFPFLTLSMSLMLFVLAMHLTWRARHYYVRAQLARITAGAMLACFAYLYGAWAFGSIYLRNVLALGWIIAAGLSLLRSRQGAKAQGRTVSFLVLAFLFLVLNILFFTGTAGNTGYAELQFPLKGGRYLVLQGGRGLPANIFHYSNHHAVYAMDIVKLDKWGRRGEKVFSKRLDDYFIYGDTVFAPCAGIVVRAVSDNPDNTPPDRRRGPHNLNGVVIHGERCTVFLGHMQQGRVFVRVGQAIVAGQALGLAGNSGMSIEPHLHIQAHALSNDIRLWYAQPQLFMRFDGKEYLLNDQIISGSSTQ